jgi:hypothetical protein
VTYGDRKAERKGLEHRYPVNLMGVDGTWRRACVLLDISETGARLEVDGTVDVLKAREFYWSCPRPDWHFGDASWCASTAQRWA